MKFINAQLLNGEHIIQIIPFSRRGVTIEAILILIPFLALLGAIMAIDTGYVGAEFIQQKVFELSKGELAISRTIAIVIAGVSFALVVKLVTGNSTIELLLRGTLGLPIVLYFMVDHLIGRERAITNYRLLRKSGIIRTHFDDETLERLRKSTYTQTIMGKLFNYGEIKVTNFRDEEMVLTLVDHPAEITKLLNSMTGRQAFTRSPHEEVLPPETPVKGYIDHTSEH